MTIREVGLTSEDIKRIKDEFDKSIVDHDNRIRAEVLAGHLAYFEKVAKGCADRADKETGEVRAAWYRQENWYENCADDLKQLQPAASDLEALLREERLNEANAHSTAFNLAMLTHQPEKYVKWREGRIAELEKARAEGKG